MTRRIAGLLFVITGASALLAEQAFEKLLDPLLGTTVHAASAVLAIYFAGLTIGAWAHRFVRRRATPIRTYAVLEAGIGGWALLLYILFEHLTGAFLPLLRTVADNFAALDTARLLVASFWILPPTIMMGATFPAMVDFLSTQPDSRRAISSFYALNLLGAMIAAGAAPYFIFATVGLDKALLVAAALDLTVAIAAALLARGASVTPVDDSIAEHAVSGSDRRRVIALVFAAGCSGFLFFALEVVWTHLIAAVCGNSVYAFAAMLFAVLTGLFIGSAIASRLAPAGTDVGVAVPAFAIILGAALLVAQQIAWPHVPHAFTVAGPHVHSFAGAEIARTGVTFALVVPVAILLGGVLPLLFRLRDFPLDAEATTAGAMTAANAIGCCAGALLAAFVLIPVVGSEASLLAIAIAYAAVGVAVLVLSSARTRIVGLACVAATVAISGLAPHWDRLQLTSGENVYFAPSFVTPATKLLFFHEDAAGGITTVIQNSPGLRTLLTNGKFQGSNGGEVPAQVGFSVVPEMYCDHFDDALVIGFGTGQSAAVTNAMGFRRIDIAEIAPGILAASDEWFPDINGHVIERPNVRTFVEDGRNVLQLHDKRYDVIIMEITSIWFAGATNLYSREFYRTAAARLQPGGVLQQWVQLHHTTPRELASTLATARSVFGHVTLWIIGGQGIIVASQSPQILHAEGIARALRIVGAGGMRDLLRRRALSDADCDRAIAGIGAPLNTDRNRWLEYRSPRYNINPPYGVNENIAALRRFAQPSPLVAEPAARSLLQAVSRR